MGWVVWKTLLMQLTPIETIHKELQGCLQGLRATRKTARASSQASQIMAQLGIIAFDRVGVGFTLGDRISPTVIPQAVISLKGIAIVASGFGCFVYHLLNGSLGSLPDNPKAQVAASKPVYEGDDEDLVFLSPIKVNNSSISASFTAAGTGGSGNRSACALTHKETVR